MSESYGRRGYAERGYAERKYGGWEYAERDHDERGYAERDYAERGYAERDDAQRGYAERDYAERDRSQRGYAERDRAQRGYAERQSAGGGQKSTRTGGVILAALAVFSTFLVLWGLYYATGTGERHKVALAAAGCEPNLLSNNVPCVTVQMLDSQYKSIANPVIQQVNADVADYTANEMHNLTAAEAALGAEVTTETGFDTSLAGFPFPPSIAPIAKTLIRDIRTQVKLTAQQARSSSLSQMRSFDGQVGVAGAAVRTELGLVAKALKRPVTPAQEP
jgi:hypothetical protein